MFWSRACRLGVVGLTILVRGRELAAIRETTLYRRRHQTFEAYCEERWEMTDRHAEHLMKAAGFAEKANYSSLPVPVRETHIRPLLKLDNDDDRLAIWRGGQKNTRFNFRE